ncbi:cytidine deaminase-like protein [Blastocladiella britannica]|nr:cytidine deaminase-like protein [Blastocladiella britannica]
MRKSSGSIPGTPTASAAPSTANTRPDAADSPNIAGLSMRSATDSDWTPPVIHAVVDEGTVDVASSAHHAESGSLNRCDNTRTPTEMSANAPAATRIDESSLVVDRTDELAEKLAEKNADGVRDDRDGAEDMMSTTESEYDARWMVAALELAQEALDVGEVPVGCVFVRQDQIIGRGRNYTVEMNNGSRHAEMVAIDQIYARPDLAAIPSADLFGCTDLYVTVEPCVMCASALRQLGVRQVYFGCGNERFGGCGSVLSIHDMEAPGSTTMRPLPCASGMFRDEAILLLRQFYVRENETAPNPRKKANRVLKTGDLALAESCSS